MSAEANSKPSGGEVGGRIPPPVSRKIVTLMYDYDDDLRPPAPKE